MAVARVKTWSSELLTSTDLNAEFNNILNNGTAVAFPLTAGVSAAGFNISMVNGALKLDSDGASQIDSATDDLVRILVNAIVVQRWQTTASGVNFIDTYAGATGAPPILRAEGANTNINLALRPKGTGEVVQRDGANNDVGWCPRGYLDGCLLSTAGSSATMTIGTSGETYSGHMRDRTEARNIRFPATLDKTTSAWAVGTGNGGLDTGVIANATWYYFYVIVRSDTGVVDVVFSTNATTPTMPTSYDYRRYIGAGRTDGSAQWIKFSQAGEEFLWDAAVLDVDATNPGTAAVTPTLTIPRRRGITALFNLRHNTGGVTSVFLASSPMITDAAASESVAPLGNASTSNASTTGYSQLRIRANTSGQIRYRLSGSDGSTTVKIATTGWIDTRERDI